MVRDSERAQWEQCFEDSGAPNSTITTVTVNPMTSLGDLCTNPQVTLYRRVSPNESKRLGEVTAVELDRTASRVLWLASIPGQPGESEYSVMFETAVAR